MRSSLPVGKSSLLASFTLAAVLTLSGCSSPLSEAELVARASEAIANGDLAAAELDVKTALQQNPENAAARTLYGRIYLTRLEPSLAVAEFERALESNSLPDTELYFAKALLEAGESAEVVSKWEAGDFLALTNDGEFRAVLARAYLVQGEYGRAREALALASTTSSPYVVKTQAIFALRLDKDPSKAREMLEALVIGVPDDDQAWRLLSGIAYEEGDRELAVELLGKAVAANAYNLSDRIRRIQLQIDMGKVDDAEKDLARLEQLVPDSPQVSFLRGQMYFNVGDYENALAMFDRVLGRFADDPRALLLAAHANARLGNLETAQRQLSKFRVRYPTNLQSGLLLGSVLMQLGDAERAAELSRGILQEHAMNVQALGILAAALAAQGLNAESAQYYAQIAELAPESSAAMSALGSQELLSGNLEGGILSLQSAVTLQPENAAAHENLVEAQLGAGDIEGAAKTALQYEQSIGGARALVFLGRVRARQNKADEASEAFNAALNLAPGDPFVSANLAALALSRGDSASALKVLDEALRANPGDLDTAMRLSLVQEQQGDYEGMEASLRSAVDANPQALGPRIVLARLELRRNAAEDALTLLTPFAAESQNNPEYLDVLVRSYLLAGEPESAENVSRRLMELRPDDLETLTLVGRVYNARQRYEVAENHLRQSLSAFSDDVGLRKALIETLVYQGKLELAQIEVDQLPNEVRNEVPVVVLRGRLALAARDFRNAQLLFEDAFIRAPSSTTVVFLAGSKWSAGEQHAAIDQLEQWLEKRPEDLMVLMSLATYQMELKDFDSAQQLYTKVVGIQPKNIPALNNLAWLIKSADTDAAMKYIQRADELAPMTPQIKDTYAMVELERGNFDRALSLNDLALEGPQKSPDVLFNRAQILWRSGEEGQARSILQELVDGPAFASQEKARQLLESM